ncbi:MAG: hypothetical protein P8Y07_14980, partial [Gemmatimonadales bacterium]
MRTIRPLPTLAFVSLVALPACSGDSNTGPPPPAPPAPPPALGSVRVAVTTTGDDFDLSAYLVSIGDDVQLIEWNDVATFNDLSAGDHFVDLEDVAENCSVAGSATKQTTVAAGATADVAFDISCAALPPAEVDVTGTWDGEWEGTDNVGGGSGSGSIRFELEQDGVGAGARDKPDAGSHLFRRCGPRRCWRHRIAHGTWCLQILYLRVDQIAVDVKPEHDRVFEVGHGIETHRQHDACDWF